MKRLLLILLLFPSLAFAQKRDFLYHSLEVTYVSLNALDLITTYKGLEYGARELNPVIGRIIENKPLAITYKAASVVLFLGITRKIRIDHPKLAFITLIAANAGYAYLVNRNYQICLSLRL